MQTFELPSSKGRQSIKEVGGMVATFITSLCAFITISSSVACRSFPHCRRNNIWIFFWYTGRSQKEKRIESHSSIAIKQSGVMLWRHAAMDPSLRWIDGKHVHRPLSEPFPKYLASWTIFCEKQCYVCCVCTFHRTGNRHHRMKGTLEIATGSKMAVFLFGSNSEETYN